MKKLVISVVLALVLVVVPASAALADDYDTVTVTATPTYIAIVNAPDTADFGLVTEGGTPALSGGETHFTITNSSSVAIDTTIKCNGWSGTSSWAYGASGADQGQLLASNGSGGYTITVPEDPTTIALHSNVGTGTNPQWGLQLEAPSSFSYGYEQTTTVTITAAQTP